MEYLSYLPYIVLAFVLFIYRDFIKRMIVDTLFVNGKMSQKRLGTFTSFYIAVFYALIPIYLPNFVVHEFVFLGLIGYGGWSLLRTQKKNENINNNENQL